MTAASREREWASWMRAANAGDATAYRRFLSSVAPHVRAIACSRARYGSEAGGEIEDIVQEVLLTIHLKRGTWDDTRPIGPWVSAITRNKMIDSFRRRGRHVSIPIEDVIDVLPAANQEPDLTGRDIDTLLGHLKAQQQDIVRSISLGGAGIRETADRLRMSEGAVRVALHRALKALGAVYRRSLRED